MSDIRLPPPREDGAVSVERALSHRRSIRDFKPGTISLEQVSTLLWAAQGTVTVGGYRTAPSAGALYPLEILLVAGAVDGLSPGVYRYGSATHSLSPVLQTDPRASLAEASFEQRWMEKAPAMIMLTAFRERTTEKYGGRGEAFVHAESGHAAQNVYLEAVALGLGTCAVCSMEPLKVREILALQDGEQPLCILPVGPA